jgi:hypothetical protein
MEVNPDLFALPGLDATPQGLQFNLTRALPVTVYICPKCGRFKFMSAILLKNVEPMAAPATQLPQAAPADGQKQSEPNPVQSNPAQHSDT